jgi:hypothetical protein
MQTPSGVCAPRVLILYHMLAQFAPRMLPLPSYLLMHSSGPSCFTYCSLCSAESAPARQQSSIALPVLAYALLLVTYGLMMWAYEEIMDQLTGPAHHYMIPVAK